VNGVVRYMLAVFMLDLSFQDVSHQNFVLCGFQNKELVLFVQTGLERPNFLGANGSLNFIQCPQTLLTVLIHTFISIDMILELMLSLLARIMYLTLAVSALKLCFFCLCPYHIGVDEYINAELLVLYKNLTLTKPLNNDYRL